MKRMKSIVAAIAIAFAIQAAVPAHADEFQNLGVAAVAAGAFLGVGIPGIITAIANSVSTAGKRPSKSWRIAGYVFGALNLVAAVGLGASSNWRNSAPLMWTLPPLALGAINLGVSIYSSRKADRLSTRVSLVPITGQGAKGSTFGGVGVRVASF